MNNADAMLQNKPGTPAGMPGFIRIGNRRQQLLLLEQTCFLFDVHFSVVCTQAIAYSF